MLPSDFAALEPYADWILATEHLDKFDLGDLPEPERNLLLLMFSLVMVSFPVEVWKQARVPDSGAAYLDLVVEPRV